MSKTRVVGGHAQADEDVVPLLQGPEGERRPGVGVIAWTLQYSGGKRLPKIPMLDGRITVSAGPSLGLSDTQAICFDVAVNDLVTIWTLVPLDAGSAGHSGCAILDRVIAPAAACAAQRSAIRCRRRELALVLNTIGNLLHGRAV